MKALIKSMRLRTLPLSLAGVVCGGLLAMFFRGEGNIQMLLLVAMTACLLQILSNLSNEMGDYKSGVDGENREGPSYGMANGLTEKQLWKAINGTVVACCFCGLAMIWVSYCPWWMLLFGVAAIWAATHYTLGKKPYGYIGLGDLFVFIFFGLVSVLGSYFVLAHTIDLKLWLLAPAVGMGLLSVAVLNVNNIRDMESDRGTRLTIPIRIGEQYAKWYQTTLVAIGVGCFYLDPIRPYLILVTLPFFILHLVVVWRGHGRKLDPALPMLVISTFVLAVLYSFNAAYSPLRYGL